MQKMITAKKGLFIMIVFVLLTTTTYRNNLFAAAFQLIPQSTKGAGNAYAGEAARAEDASTVFFNPAGMTLLSGDQTKIGLNIILPKIYFKGVGTFNADHPSIQAAKLSDIAYDQGSGNYDAKINGGILANIAYVHDYSKNLKFGISFNTPFGMGIKYNERWAGRYATTESKLITFNINPSIGYRLNRQLSVGGGFNFMYATAEMSNAIDYNLIYKLVGSQNSKLPNFSLIPGQYSGDGITKLKGEDWGFGYNLGLLWELSKGTRIGLSYRSKISLGLNGNMSFTQPSDSRSQQAMKILQDTAGLFKDGSAQTNLTLPDTLALNLYHNLSLKWTILGSINWTKWDRVKDLIVKFDDATQADVITSLNYENSTFFALGLSYKYNPQLTLRTGIAYDQSPISNAETRSPSVPDDDYLVVAFGASYTANKHLSFDIGYTHTFADDRNINSSESYNAGTYPSGYHRLNGKYTVNTDILSLQCNWKF